MKGIIALDLDGTLTARRHHELSQEVIEYLNWLSHEKWYIVFLTGRTFKRAYRLLQVLTIPYLLAAYNGAVIVEMPGRRILKKTYLSKDILPALEIIHASANTDFILYSGIELDDQCYFRPQNLSPDVRSYLKARTDASGEKWIEVPSFHTLDEGSFASIKCFGHADTILPIAAKIENELGLHVPAIGDPFHKDFFVAQGTHGSVCKGEALRYCNDFLGSAPVIIAAGDDNNDKSMFDYADISIAMSTAPQDIQKLADIIAPSAAENGIIVGIKEALSMRYLYDGNSSHRST